MEGYWVMNAAYYSLKILFDVSFFKEREKKEEIVSCFGLNAEKIRC